jgi:hypothetical protein
MTCIACRGRGVRGDERLRVGNEPRHQRALGDRVGLAEHQDSECLREEEQRCEVKGHHAAHWPFAVLLPILAPFTDRFPGGYRAVIVGTAAGRAGVVAAAPPPWWAELSAA